MSSTENRIKKLEKRTSYTEEKPWLVVVYDDTGKPNEAALEEAKAKCRATHPDWQERDFNVIWVTDENAKQLAERVIAGERTG